MYNQQLEQCLTKEQLNHIVVSNLSYAERLAKQYYSKRTSLGMQREDFVSAAYYGLCDAATRYADNDEKNFQTYSYLRIRGAMCDLLRKEGIVPRGYLKKKTELKKTKQKLNKDKSNRLEQAIDNCRVAGNYPYEVANTASQLATYSEVFDELGYKFFYDGERDACDIGYADDSNPEEILAKKNLKEFIKANIEALSSPYKEILKYHYYQDLSFKDICVEVQVLSRGSVCRMHQRALELLKEKILEQNKKSHLRCQVQQRIASS
jgi:RNA polymerase sigma factor for flagellar operon FliA